MEIRLDSPAPSTSLLRAKSIAKNFSGVKALRSASFDLRAGEVHALIGENGAGKSTLIKVITGAVIADSGSLEVAGNGVAHNSPAVARSLGIAAIYQQPTLFPHLTVAENVALTLEAERPARIIDWKLRNARAKELLERLGSSIEPARLASSLSMAEQQIVEIAKALGTDAKVVIMDEPTALLTDREVDNLFRLVRRLREDGVGIIYISHRLEEIAAIADRITVMRDGETIACRDAGEVGRAELIQMMVGREVSSVFPKREVQPGAVALSVSGLNNPAVGLHDISLTLRSGEIVGLAGLVGAGRTELASTLFGLTAGRVRLQVHGEAVEIESPADAIGLGIGYVPEDRRQHGAILDMSIAANISMASLGAVSHLGILDSAKESALADKYVECLRIKTASIATATGTLSGGNQQKVALARWLAIHPRIMILDEPTQGVDVGSKAEIYEFITQLAEDGVAVLLISSELPEILGMSDRVAVMRGGRIVGVLGREEATQASVMSLAFGHTVSTEALA